MQIKVSGQEMSENFRTNMTGAKIPKILSGKLLDTKIY